MPSVSPLRLAVLVLLSLIAFAANSVLTRLAIHGAGMGAGAFASIRVISGSVILLALVAMRGRGGQAGVPQVGGNWTSALWLFGYAIPFSLAYVGLPTGMGALILFGAVQLTMIGAGFFSGDRPNPTKWLGIGTAVAGLAYLLLPGASAPPLGMALLMAVAGISWGAYSLRGRSSKSPMSDTGGNMLRASPLVALAAVTQHFLDGSAVSWGGSPGILLAVSSGALASGVGYAIWYSALPHLKAITAATLQLSVPILAALGGVLFVDESVTARLLLSSAMILGGTAIALFSRRARSVQST